MSVSARPFRSALYMPGANARAIEKAKSLHADALIFDLEDAVAPDAKEKSRVRVRNAVGSRSYGRRYVMARANGLDTLWGEDDIAAIAPAGPDGLVIPKVESAAMVADAVRQLEAGGAPAETTLWCMIETPRGIQNINAIAAASDRLGGLIMGTSDLTKDLAARHTQDRLPMLFALSACLIAARANGLVALDGVHLDLADDAGFRCQCQQGAELGFDGKTLIHPKTLATANAVFGPTDDDVGHARRVIEAHRNAETEGKGVVLLDGKLIENLHVENAQRIVALAEAVRELEDATID